MSAVRWALDSGMRAPEGTGLLAQPVAFFPLARLRGVSMMSTEESVPIPGRQSLSMLLFYIYT